MRLIDADANIETMKKCAENPESEQALLCYRYTQRILEEAPTVPAAPRWHRVEEPPKKEGRYLTLDKAGFVHLNWWGPKYGWAYDPNLFSYWMPIPEPPKEDA